MLNANFYSARHKAASNKISPPPRPSGGGGGMLCNAGNWGGLQGLVSDECCKKMRTVQYDTQRDHIYKMNCEPKRTMGSKFGCK